MAEERTFYDGRWHAKNDPSTPQDPASQVAQLRADLIAQLAALAAATGVSFDANALTDSSQTAQLTSLLTRMLAAESGVNDAAAINTTQTGQLTALLTRMLAAETATLEQLFGRLGIPVPLGFVKPAGGWDTAFDLDPTVMTSADLAAHGWTVTLTHPPHTVLTRAGDVRTLDHLWSAAASGQTPGTTPNYPPAAGTYYSSIVGGRLLLQFPGETDVSIWRATNQNAAVYSAGIGGGDTQYHGRQLYLSNGPIQVTGSLAGFVQDASVGTTTLGGGLGGFDAGGGAQAVHLALEAAAYLAVASPVGRYLRAGTRGLFTQGAGMYIAASSIIDTSMGLNTNAPLSRCAVRLRSGPMTYRSHISNTLELFYIRRRPHRAHGYF